MSWSRVFTLNYTQEILFLNSMPCWLGAVRKTCNKCQQMDKERVSEWDDEETWTRPWVRESLLMRAAVTLAFRAVSSIPASLEQLKNWLHGVSCFPSSRRPGECCSSLGLCCHSSQKPTGCRWLSLAVLQKNFSGSEAKRSYKPWCPQALTHSLSLFN